MNHLLQDLTSEQRCAMIGLAFDIYRSNVPSKDKQAQANKNLDDFYNELGLSRAEVGDFINRMTTNGGVKYATQILKSVVNKRTLGLIYPNLYSLVATLDSPEALEQLNLLYIEEFGYNDDDIKTLWDLYEIKDFRKVLPAYPTELELIEFVSKNKSFITLKKYFEEWIKQGCIKDRIYSVKWGYITLISSPNIFLTESRAVKELKAAKVCYDIWLKYDKDGIKNSLNSEDENDALAAKISILPPEKNILLRCDELFTLHYLLMGLYDSYNDEELAKINGDDYAKVWLKIFAKGYHFGNTDKEYDVDRNHFNTAFRYISKMALSPEYKEQMNLEKIKARFNHYYHLDSESSNSGSGCMVYLIAILTTTLMIACTL